MQVRVYHDSAEGGGSSPRPVSTDEDKDFQLFSPFCILKGLNAEGVEPAEAEPGRRVLAGVWYQCVCCPIGVRHRSDSSVTQQRNLRQLTTAAQPDGRSPPQTADLMIPVLRFKPRPLNACRKRCGEQRRCMGIIRTWTRLQVRDYRDLRRFWCRSAHVDVLVHGRHMHVLVHGRPQEHTHNLTFLLRGEKCWCLFLFYLQNLKLLSRFFPSGSSPTEPGLALMESS